MPKNPKIQPAWAARAPSYRRQKCITLRPDAFDALDAKRPRNESWSVFLCRAVGVTLPADRRFNRKP